MVKKDELYLDAALEVAKKQQYKVSLLIDNPLPKKFGEGKESYVGKIEGIDKKFVYLNLIHNQRLVALVIKKSMILSMWIYRE